MPAICTARAAKGKRFGCLVGQAGRVYGPAMDKTRRFRIPAWPVVLLLLAGGLVANLPRDWFEEKTPDERRAEVFSAFVNLSADPGRNRGQWTMDWLTWTGQLRKRREARLEHIHPALLNVFAERMEISVDTLSAYITDPLTRDPFDLSNNRFDAPFFAEHGSSQVWYWAFSAHDRPTESQQAAKMNHCGIWLVFWDMEDWFYAPVGRDDLNEALLTAFPDLGDIGARGLSRC